MQQGGGGGGQDPGHAQQDQSQVEGHDEAVVPVDAPHQGLAHGPEVDQGGEIVRRDGDIRDLPGDGRPGGDGDAHVRLAEGGAVVDAVADHDDLAPGGVLRADEGGLVLRQDLGAVLVHPHGGGHGAGSPLAVAGHHHEPGDAQAPQLRHDGGSLRPQGVLHAEDGGQLAGDGQKQVGILVRQGGEAFLLALRQGAALVLEDEVVAADDHLFPVHPAGDAVGHHVLHFGVPLLVAEVPLPGGVHHGVGHGVGVVLFETGGQPQHLVLGVPAEGHHQGQAGHGVGQGAGLVKDDGLRLGGGLQELAALHPDAALAALPHGGEDGDGHGELQRAGEVHHQNGQGLGGIPGQKISQRRGPQAPGDKPIRQVGGLVLRGGFQLLRGLDHLHDPVVAAAAAGLVHPQGAAALLHHRPGVDVAARGLVDGEGLPGHGGLVDAGLPADDDAVQRDEAAGADDDDVPHLHVRDVHQDLLVPGLEPDLVHVEAHGLGQVGHGLLVGPLLQDLADLQQEHDAAGRAAVPPQEGDGDGHGVQHRHLDVPVEQAGKAPL